LAPAPTPAPALALGLALAQAQSRSAAASAEAAPDEYRLWQQRFPPTNDTHHTTIPHLSDEPCAVSLPATHCTLCTCRSTIQYLHVNHHARLHMIAVSLYKLLAHYLLCQYTSTYGCRYCQHTSHVLLASWLTSLPSGGRPIVLSSTTQPFGSCNCGSRTPCEQLMPSACVARNAHSCYSAHDVP